MVKWIDAKMGIADQNVWPEVLSMVMTEIPLMVEAADVLVDVEYVTTPTQGFVVNGVGDDAHEPFAVGIYESTNDEIEPRRLFTKTNRKPYDLLVCLILLRIKQIAMDAFAVSSDGIWDREWTAARKLYNVLWPGQHPKCPWPADAGLTSTTSLEVPRTSSALGLTDVADSENSTAAISQSRDLRRLIAPPFSTSDVTSLRNSVRSINSALSQCENGSKVHSCCVPELMFWEARPGVQFRLIDVVRGCIVEVPDPTEPYVALSYVWGGTRQLQLTEATYKDLTIPGYLLDGSLQPSNTVMDAITVCQTLRARYLWVDTLCIKQDDSRDKAIQILRMRQIYASAYLTIIAACGQNADSSLFIPQVSDELTTSEIRVLQDTKWNSRAWTYQESRLSHRKLIFAPSGIYLRCQKMMFKIDQETFLECPLNEKEQSGTFIDHVSATDGQLSIYYQAVSEFSNRDLTFQADLVNAFQGIIKSFGYKIDGQDNVFFWGLPTVAFDQAFCWQTDGDSPHLRRAEYPSWSWLGWQQHVFWDQQHGTAHDCERTSILLWPQRSSSFWTLPIGQYMLQDHAERMEKGLPENDPSMAHMFANRKACWYSDWSITEAGTFTWGVPAAMSIYHQGKVLTLWGSVAKLEVRAVFPTVEEINDGIVNRFYHILTPRTGIHLATMKLDPTRPNIQIGELTFVLLDGIQETDGVFVGTHLMCLDETGYNNTKYGAVSISCERLAVVRCETFVSEEVWREAGAVTKLIYIH